MKSLILILSLLTSMAYGGTVQISAEDISITFKVLSKNTGPEPVVIIDGLDVGKYEPDSSYFAHTEGVLRKNVAILNARRDGKLVKVEFIEFESDSKQNLTGKVKVIAQ